MPNLHEITCKCGFIMGLSETEVVGGIVCNYCIEERVFFRRMFTNNAGDITRLEKQEDEVSGRVIDRKCDSNQTMAKIRNIAEITEIELEENTHNE